ncbi:hypothetical protein ACWKW1_28270, partial [Brevibacillus parabrevis]
VAVRFAPAIGVIDRGNLRKRAHRFLHRVRLAGVRNGVGFAAALDVNLAKGAVEVATNTAEYVENVASGKKSWQDVAQDAGDAAVSIGTGLYNVGDIRCKQSIRLLHLEVTFYAIRLLHLEVTFYAIRLHNGCLSTVVT